MPPDWDERYFGGVKDDPVEHPSHYMVMCWVTLAGGERVQARVECADLMEALGFDKNAYLWSAFSYFWRHAMKNGIQDLLKMVWYINRHITLCDIQHERGN